MTVRKRPSRKTPGTSRDTQCLPIPRLPLLKVTGPVFPPESTIPVCPIRGGKGMQLPEVSANTETEKGSPGGSPVPLTWKLAPCVTWLGVSVMAPAYRFWTLIIRKTSTTANSTMPNPTLVMVNAPNPERVGLQKWNLTVASNITIRCF